MLHIYSYFAKLNKDFRKLDKKMEPFEVDIRPLTERIADKIEDLIKAEQLQPGDRVPAERELAGLLGIGRSTVRESIKILVSRNVLEIRRGRGTFVRDALGVMEDPLGLRFINDKKKLALDLNQIRSMVEPQIAAIAAQNAADADIAILQSLCDTVALQISQNQDYAKKDIEFHTRLAKLTDNLVIPKIIPIITQGIQIYVDLTEHRQPGKAASTHQAVVTAVKNHDSPAASQAMAEHLRENRETIKSLAFW